MLTGRCLCGETRYEADAAPFNATICHCRDCQRATGAASVGWFSVPRGKLRFPNQQPVRFRSGPMAVRGHCGRCGTPLLYEGDDYPDEVDVTIVTLDNPAGVHPEDHTFAGSRVAWDAICDGLPAHDRTRPSR